MHGPGEAHRGTLAHSSGEQVERLGELLLWRLGVAMVPKALVKLFCVPRGCSLKR